MEDANYMIALLRNVSTPLLSLVFLMMGSGLMNTFISVRLDIEGFGAESVGFVSSASYLGILIGSIWIDRYISKVGHIFSYVTFAIIFAIITMAQTFWVEVFYWAFLRGVGGICMAGVFIVIESWLLMQSPMNFRGVILSIYLAVLYAALASGQFLIELADPKGPVSFYIGSALCLISAIPVLAKKSAQPKLTEHKRLGIARLYRLSPLGFIGGIISGMLLAIVYGLVPVYANEVGMSVSEIATLMAVLIFGGFSLQLPLGRWADKTDRRKVLNLISFTTAILALCIAFTKPPSFTVFLLLAGAFGGFSFTLYPISMAYACENVKGEQIVAATGGFVLSYSLGAIGGPLLAPLAMYLFGPSGLFLFLAAITTVLGLIGLKKPAPVMLDE